uniref:Variant surface glycoprotein 1125.2510 n=1 Tax=Trypanosoma brucei TaxID=5691 RepID=A0A1J0R8A8_9TRYP|nr:variant surface glycoprotein 1125.2510 [Trypanosoma brucei]
MHSNLGKFIFLLAAASTLGEFAQAGNIQSGANSAVFATLCKFVKAADARLDATQAAEDPEQDYRILQKLNMSISDAGWQNMFIETPKPLKLHDAPTKANVGGRGFDDDWKDWKRALAAIKADEADTDVKNSGLQQLNEVGKAAARLHLAPILQAARTAMHTYRKMPTAATDLTAAEIQKELKLAVYGAAARTSADLTEAEIFGSGSGSNRQTTCKATGTASEPYVRTVAAAITCLCYDHTGGITDPCVATKTPSNKWNAAGKPGQPTEVRDIIKLCGKATKTTLTSSQLSDMLESVKAAITVHTTNGYLGAVKSGSCTGEGNAGVCVQIDNYGTDPDSALKTLTWYNQLSALQAKLQKLENKVEAARSIRDMLKQNIDTVKHLALHIKSLPQQPAAAISAPTKTDIATIKNCDKHNDNKTACENTGKCNWEGTEETKGTCKVDKLKLQLKEMRQEQKKKKLQMEQLQMGAQHTSMIRQLVKEKKVVNGKLKLAKIPLFL